MNCELCGLPTPKPPLRDDGHAFCCVGCREVYLSFGSEALGAPGTRPLAPRRAPVPIQGTETFLRIEGMHCSSCERLIERAASRVEGILSANASYATSTMRVTYDPALVRESELPELLSLPGYRARLRRDADPEEEDERPALLRLIAGLTLNGVVMMLNMAFYYPAHLGLVEPDEMAAIGDIAYYAAPRAMLVLTSLLVFYVGAPILRGAWTGFRTGMLNMDSLLAVAILSSYGYSAGRMLTGALDLYFDVAAMIVAVVTLGRYFEQGARTRAVRELTRFIEAGNPVARVRSESQFQMLPLDALKPGDRVFVREGEAIPVDGTVVDGAGAVDESLMSGEPFPVARKPGERVLGGARLVEGELEIEAGPVVESRMDRLARTLWDVQSSIAGVRSVADRIARVFVPVVLAAAGAVAAWFLARGAEPGDALLAGLATLIVSCPCAFGLAIPLTSTAGVSAALRRGVMITSADAFEKAASVDVFALDMTGTLSTGKMTVAAVLGPPEVVARAAAVERLSSHPVAQAIAGLDSCLNASDPEIHPGQGAEAIVDGRRVVVGSRSLFARLAWEGPGALAARAGEAAAGEGTVSYVGWDGTARGAIVTRDQRRSEWAHVVERLRKHARVMLLTGAEHPGDFGGQVDQVFAGVPPEGKAAVIRRLRTEGTVAMIGDGSNDAPALAAADLGIAFGAPTALAVEAADVVIPGDRLERVFDALEILQTTRRRIRQNLAWTFSYNAIAIPVAMAGLLNPVLAALAMAASSLVVVANAARPIGSIKAAAPPIQPTGNGFRIWPKLCLLK